MSLTTPKGRGFLRWIVKSGAATNPWLEGEPMQASCLRLFNTRAEGYAAAFLKLFNAVARGYTRVLVERPDPLRRQRGLTAWRRRRDKHRRHVSNTLQAERVLAKVRSFGGEQLLARTLGYLRKIDPYVFEELVLTVLQSQGIIVIRNVSYSGDGGMDGEFALGGHRYLVQAKRYEGAINAEHVREFGNLIEERRAAGGLFIHTGRTPPGAYRNLGMSAKVTLISGQKILDLIQGEALTLWGGQRA